MIVRDLYKIQITSVDSSELRLFYNGMDVSANVTNINDTFNKNVVDIIRTEDNSIDSVFSNGVAVTLSVSLDGMLNVIVNLPVEYNSQTQGLMGNFNGNSSDDFIFPNGIYHIG